MFLFDKVSAQLDRVLAVVSLLGGSVHKPELGDKEVFDGDVPGEAIRLSPEEWYEIRAALMANIKREAEELPSLAKQFPFMNTKGGVLDRARHSVAIQKLVLKKIQEM